MPVKQNREMGDLLMDWVSDGKWDLWKSAQVKHAPRARKRSSNVPQLDSHYKLFITSWESNSGKFQVNAVHRIPEKIESRGIFKSFVLPIVIPLYGRSTDLWKL